LTFDPLPRGRSDGHSYGVISSQKIYVWSGNKIIQEQDASGNVTKDYCALGENRAGTNYFYTKDHLGSIRELTDDSGNIQAQYSYDPYGQSTKLQGSLDCDFQYAGYFYEATSGFNLMLYRAYGPTLGRWISRDPMAESAGNNLYEYAANRPTSVLDPYGLDTYLTTGNTEAPFTTLWHESICVDTWSCDCMVKTGRKCFSYGLDFPPIANHFLPGVPGLNLFALPGLNASVYPEPGGDVSTSTLTTKHTSCKQDKSFLAGLNIIEGKQGPYGVCVNCRTFAEGAYNGANSAPGSQ
jgi:RHS repeat-associated protein